MIDNLVRLYLKREDSTCVPKLSVKEAENYFSYMWNNSLISMSYENGNVTGYVEYWRITFEQFGRLICKDPFNVYEEILISGPISYLSDIYILPEYRRTSSFSQLLQKFWKTNQYCEYFVGQALRKRTQPIKVFKRQEAYMKWVKPAMILQGESQNGWKQN